MALEGLGGGKATTAKRASGRTSGGSFGSTKKSSKNVSNVQGGFTVKAPPITPVQRDSYTAYSANPSSPYYRAPAGGGARDTGMGAQSLGGGVSDDDYLASGADSAYTAQLAALMKAMQDYEADVTAQRGKYETDYGTTLKELGYRRDDPSTPEDESRWMFDDINTAAGRSHTSQKNDFASRGLLQSSLYGKANDSLTRSLTDQLAGIDTSKQNFMGDLNRQLGAYKNENTLAQQQARAEAIARRAGGIGL